MSNDKSQILPKTERTLGPWEVTKWDTALINEHEHRVLPIANNIPSGTYEGTGIAVCILPSEDYSKYKKQIEANAAFIVKACNLHDELVEALKEATEWILATQKDFNLEDDGTIDNLIAVCVKTEPFLTGFEEPNPCNP